MPKVQLIFILHVSTYRSVFPLTSVSVPVRVVPGELSWEQERERAVLSRSLPRPSQRREKPDLARTELRACGAELGFAPFRRQRSAGVVPCHGVCSRAAAGPGALLRGTQRQRGRLPLPFPSRCGTLTAAAAFHSPFRQQDKRPFGGFCYFFV